MQAETEDLEITELEEEQLRLQHPSCRRKVDPRTFCWAIFSAVDAARALSVAMINPQDDFDTQHRRQIEVLAAELRDRDVGHMLIALSQGHPMWLLEALEKTLLEGEMQ